MGKDPDLLGYRVLWANDTTHEFSQATNKILYDTVFVDTIALNTLTSHIYYRVVAVDYRRNHSKPSKILALQRPDTIAPVPPIIVSANAQEGAILLKWIPSSSKDVAYQIVQRRTDTEHQWHNLISLPPDDSLFIDQAVSPDTLYHYRITAVDQSGNVAISPLSAVNTLPSRIALEPVPMFQAFYDRKEKRVHIAWEYPYLPNQPFWFVIYRGYQMRPLEPYKAVKSETRSFEDTDLIGVGVYRYAIQVRSQLFGASPLSTVQMVEITEED